MIRRSVWCMCIGWLALIGVSCGPSPDRVYQKSVAEAQTFLEQGETNKAVGVLRGLFNNRRFGGYGPNLLSSMLEFHLGMNDVAGAQALFREAADRDPALAASAMGMIEIALSRQDRNDELADWCKILQTHAFEGDALTKLIDQHFRALTAAGNWGAVPAALGVYLGKLNEEAALSLAQAQFDGAQRAGRPDEAAAIMATVEERLAGSPSGKGLVAGMKVEVLLAGNDRAAADVHLRKNLSAIPDDIAVRNIRMVGEAHMKAGDIGAADGLAGFVLKNVTGRAGVREVAGSLWVRIAEKKGAIPEVVRRLVGLHEFGFPPSFILDRLDKVYAQLLDQGKRDDFASLYAMCRGFQGEAKDEGDKRRLTAVLLDLGFYLEKYEDALQLVETEMKGADPEQTALLTWKIKAHLALQKGQTQEAVRCFRAFMERIAKGTGSDVDPVDNTQVTKEMILGLNYKRIGDILAKAGDQAGATKAYADARENFAKALAEFPDVTSREHQKIQKQVAEIPAK